MPTTSPNNGGSSGIAARAAESAHGVVDKVADAAAPVVDRFVSSAHATVDKAASAASRLEKKSGELVAASDKLFSSATDYARNKPLVVLGVGLVIGVLISRLIR